MKSSILACLILDASNESPLKLDHMKVSSTHEAQLPHTDNSMHINQSLTLPETSQVHVNPRQQNFKKKPSNHVEVLGFSSRIEEDIQQKQSNLSSISQISGDGSLDQNSFLTDFDCYPLNLESSIPSEALGYVLQKSATPVTYTLQVYCEQRPTPNTKHHRDIYNARQPEPQPATQAKSAEFKRRFSDFRLLARHLQKLSDVVHFPAVEDGRGLSALFANDKDDFYATRKIGLQMFLHRVVQLAPCLDKMGFFRDFFDHVSRSRAE